MRKPICLLLLVVGCKEKVAPSRADAAPPKPVLPSVVHVVTDAAAPRDGGGELSSATRATVLKDLNDGRRLSRAKDWQGAITAFNKALALSPDDARVLSELGWAEFNANDLHAAETANARALANAREAAVRAPILYNVGRVADARSDKPSAIKAYRDSLALRPNAEVKRRLALLAVDGGADDEDDPVGGKCAQGFASVGALCLCMKANKSDQFFLPDDEKPFCEQDKSRAPLGDPRVNTVFFGAGSEQLGETSHYVIVRETDRTRLLSLVGSDYEPGAFGVHNAVEIKGGQSRNVGGHVVVVIKSKKNNLDTNLAGLELCSDIATQETVCAISDDHGGSKCTPPIPLDAEAGCGANDGLDPKDIAALDPDIREMFENVKRTATKSTVKTAWTIADDGTVTVTVKEGSRDLVPADVLVPHKLWN